MEPQTTTTTDKDGNVTITTVSTTVQMLTIEQIKGQAQELQTQIDTLTKQQSALITLAENASKQQTDAATAQPADPTPTSIQ